MTWDTGKLFTQKLSLGTAYYCQYLAGQFGLAHSSSNLTAAHMMVCVRQSLIDVSRNTVGKSGAVEMLKEEVTVLLITQTNKRMRQKCCFLSDCV